MEKITSLGERFLRAYNWKPFPALKVHEKVDGKYKGGRQQCIICKHTVLSYCQNCGVDLCLNKGVENEKECWTDFHTKRDIIAANKRTKTV